MKIVLNKCFGGYSLSEEAYKYLNIPGDGYGCDFKENRTNEKLIECVEALGDKANGDCAKLSIVEIPDDIEYYIGDYDGIETVHEEHRSW